MMLSSIRYGVDKGVDPRGVPFLFDPFTGPLIRLESYYLREAAVRRHVTIKKDSSPSPIITATVKKG
ncbi:hypothetical protein NQ318_019305 [Aromia moschata]|uniref:Uncharacterized protein n=1 Tax=Aromia moschata TaxID=1265417 RepID=A0AAV8YBE2_9CUCU|nr:hypothetical protein NQ318_019305 [Aromia moschata]